MSTRLARRVIGKSASYTLTAGVDKPGSVFSNEGAAGAVTFTLPPPGPGVYGWWYRFVGVVAQNIIVAPPVADTGIGLNDTATDSLALQTGGQIIGGEIEAQCIRTGGTTYQWHLKGIAVGHTYTLAT